MKHITILPIDSNFGRLRENPSVLQRLPKDQTVAEKSQKTNVYIFPSIDQGRNQLKSPFVKILEG